MTHTEMARALNTRQQKVSRELANMEKARKQPEMEDASDPGAFVNNFDRGIRCLVAIDLHYGEMVGKVPDEEAIEWRELSLAAYRAKFKELTEWH